VKSVPVSVHLCDFPKADESLIDEGLSADMEALLRLVSLGSAARNTVKIKVRQPLAEMRVQPGDDRDRRAVQRFGDQVREELNIEKVTLHESSNGPLLCLDVKPNMKTLGMKFRERLKEVQNALAGAVPAAVAKKVLAGQPVELPCSGGPVTLEPTDVLVQMKAPEGWAGIVDRDTQVMVDARITAELKREGMAREVVRHAQELRKQSGLEMEDRIVLHLGTDLAELRQAIEAHRDYICAETLTVRRSPEPLGAGAHRAEVKVDGQKLIIELRKA
jgi:isoleucyl-tRNA synthetase